MTALHYASKGGHQNVVKLLLKHTKGSINSVDAVSYCLMTSHTLVLFITISQMDTTPLLYAIRGKNHKVVRLFVEQDPNIVQQVIYKVFESY
jgi:ankyrin repeat protein